MGRLDDIVKRNRESAGYGGALGASPKPPSIDPPPRFQLPSQQRTRMAPIIVIPVMLLLIALVVFRVWFWKSSADRAQERAQEEYDRTHQR